MKHTIYCFDIDGVLTDTGSNIDPEFKEWFLEWSADKPYVLITGSTLERTVEQIGEEITERALFVANCMGNSIYQDGRTTIVNEFDFTKEEKQWLMDKVATSPFPIRAGNHIVMRQGSANFSIVGRDASVDERLEYKNYDMNAAERLALASEFKSKFQRFDVYIGGDISIDICLKGSNKAQLLDIIGNFWPDFSLLFYADKMGPWGIDEPLKQRIAAASMGASFEILGGYQETKKMLQ